MKRFLFISIFLHAGVLLLLFSWEIPLAGRLPAGSVVEVSLIERIEGKPEGKKEEEDRKPGKRSSEKRDVQGRKKVDPSPGVPPAKEESKIEEPKPEKIEPVQKEIEEEKTRPEEKRPSPPPVLTAAGEEFPVLMARLAPPSGGIAETREPAGPLKDSPPSVFLASAGPESGKDGIAVETGGKN